MDDLDYVEFSEIRSSPSLIPEVCILSFFYFPSSILLKCDAHDRLIFLPVVLLTHPIYLGQFMLMALTALLGSAL